MDYRYSCLAVLLGLLIAPSGIVAQSSRTQIVMLGTGTPIPDPDRSGPAVAIVVDSVAYLFDAGAGVVRRAAAAGRNGIKAFAPMPPSGQFSPRFDRVFLTHLHSDHTLGLADVIFTPWIQGRIRPLDVYGPRGTQRLVNGILDGNAEDIAERLHASAGPPANGWKVAVHEIAEGIVFQDSRITVTAFAVPHADWKYAADSRSVLHFRVRDGSTAQADLSRSRAHVGHAARRRGNSGQAKAADSHAPAFLWRFR